MHDKYRATNHGDFNTLANTFTQGLRELPTDYAARVKNFLAEYLGSPRHPVPFGGRIKDFEYLDDWLADTGASPYLLLAAPAGRGKSALLLRWCQRLLARRDVAVAYFPVSIRFRTNLAGVAFPSLVALLARLHGEKIPADPNTHEEVWRGLLFEYMTRPLPDGRSLVLVLDGVDEAADWTAGSGLFPLNPPAGLRIVLSARYLANDEDANAWLKRLNWTRPGLARTLELYPLDRTGIASVLVQMGFPLDLLSTRVNIVSELYRLSEGDPLLVRLYVDDLWERGEAAVRFQPEDLRAIRPGLAGYFERWWKDQRLLWSKDAPQREAAAQSVLNLLAGALGPLSKDDILSLLPSEAALASGDLEQHLASLARFVTGDGVHQGYVFSHPRLGNYFLEERLSEEERLEVERRFLNWGEHTLVALNEERLAAERASNYIIQYYGAHLERAQADVHVLSGLVSDGWRRAWEKLDRANAGFLGDVERAWRAAERADAALIVAGEQALYLGEEIRCLLAQVSVNSMTSNISPRLMLEAVKTGIWTPAQGLASIRLITEPVPRARELVALAPYVQEPLRTDILQEALDTLSTIKDEYARLDALVELAPGLSEELLWQVLEAIPAIEDEADRAGVLSELAPGLSSYENLVASALDFVQALEEEEYRALALEGLAPCFSADQHVQVLQFVLAIQDERYRAQALAALLPCLAENLLSDVLREVRAMQDGLAHIRLLAKLVTYLPKQLQAEVVQEALTLERDIEDREYRIEVLVALAPFLPEENLQQALQEIELLWDESYRASALSDLIPYVPQALLPALEEAVLAMKSEEARTKVLLQLLPHLPEELLEKALDSIQATWDEGRRAELVAQIAPYTPETLLPRLLEIVPKIEDQGYRVWLLTELEVPLAGKIYESYFSISALFQAIKAREDRLQTLLAITPRLSDAALSKIFDFMLPEVFDFSWRVRNEEQRAHILTKLGGRLPQGWLSTALKAARELSAEVYKVQALLALAPRVGAALLSEALDIVRELKDREKRAQVLELLVSSLPEERKGERVREMLQILQIIKDETDRVHLTVANAAFLPTTLSSAQAEIVLTAVYTMHDEKHQTQILKTLLSRLPADTFERVFTFVHDLHNGEEQVQMLEAMLPSVPENLFSQFLTLVLSLPFTRWRTQVLKATVAYAPQHIIMGMLGMAPDISDEYERAELLEALGKYVSEDSFVQLWKITQALSDGGRRIRILNTMVTHMPESFFPSFWSFVRSMSDEGWQTWVLKTALPHMSESMFSQLWEAVREIRNKGKHAHILVTIAPCVPERFFPQAWEAVQALDEKTRAQAMEGLASCAPTTFVAPFFVAIEKISQDTLYTPILKTLAPRVPLDLFPQYLTSVQSISHEGMRMQVLEAVLPYVPVEQFPRVWGDIEVLYNHRLRARMLLALAPYIPTQFFPQVWDTVLSMDDVGLLMQMLKGFFPYLTQTRLVETLHLVLKQLSEDLKAVMLEALLPRLSPETRVKVWKIIVPLAEQLAALPDVEKKRWSMRTLALLVPYLPAENVQTILPPLLKVIRTLRAEDEQVWLLTTLAVNVPEELLHEMLEALWSIETVLYQEQVLAALLQPLSQSMWMRVLELVTAKMHITGNPAIMVQLLKIGATFVSQSTSSQLYPALHEMFHLQAQQVRRDTLMDLAHLAPAIRAAGNEEAIATACCSTLEVGCWWP